jgi:hypothetical protein
VPDLAHPEARDFSSWFVSALAPRTLLPSAVDVGTVVTILTLL